MDRLISLQELTKQLRQEGRGSLAKDLETIFTGLDQSGNRAINPQGFVRRLESLGLSSTVVKMLLARGINKVEIAKGKVYFPASCVQEYLSRARSSVDLEEVSDEESARLVAEGRS